LLFSQDLKAASGISQFSGKGGVVSKAHYLDAPEAEIPDVSRETLSQPVGSGLVSCRSDG
jgi:hypothetical protein